MRGKGEGSIYKKSNGTWIGQYYNNEVPAKRKTVSGKTRKEVQQKMVKALQQLAEGTYRETPKVIMKVFMQEYLENYKKQEIQRTTYDNYRECMERHFYNSNVGDMELGKITVDILQRYYNAKVESGLSSRSVRYIHSILNGGFENARKRGMRLDNPNKDVSLPRKVHKEIMPPTLDEVRKFMEYEKDKPEYGLWRVYILNGLRRSEALAIQKKDINWDTGEIKLRYSLGYIRNEGLENSKRKMIYVLKEDMKNKTSMGSIFVDEETLAALKSTMERQSYNKKTHKDIYHDSVLFMSSDNRFSMIENDLLFAKEDGYFIPGRRVLDNLHRDFEMCGIPKHRVHDLRHFFGTQSLVATGGNLKLTSSLCRHKQVSTTAEIYLHNDNIQKMEAQRKLVDMIGI